MKLLLSLPPTWQTTSDDDRGRGVQLPPSGSGPAATLRITHPVPAPKDPVAWLRERLSDGLPAGSRLAEARSADAQTATGWPLQLVEVLILPAPDAGDAPAEVRLGACYRMLDFVATAVLCGLTPAQFAADAAALQDVLRSARPSFRGPAPAALRDLWES